MNDNLIIMLHDLGTDADLLARQDSWLEQKRRMVSSELDDLINELRAIQLAQRIKRTLQQKNMVAVLKNSNDELGIKIMHLPAALQELDSTRKTDRLNAAVWQSDGYDLPNSKKLRKRKGNA